MTGFSHRMQAHKKHFTCAALVVFLVFSGCDHSSHHHGNSEREIASDNELAHNQQLSAVSNNGTFNVVIRAVEGQQASIGKFHDWTISVSDMKSNPVEGAKIVVTGGMPEHGHGLPTNPQVTNYLGNGEYLLEGVKFNMSGDWRIQIHIMADDGKTDAADFNYIVSH